MSSQSITSGSSQSYVIVDICEHEDSGTRSKHVPERAMHKSDVTRTQHSGHCLKATDPLITCDFDCGPPMPLSSMVHKANARGPCWVCTPCFCSMKALIRPWSATPEAKHMLDGMRSKAKFRWHALVRQCRIKQRIEEVGLTDFARTQTRST